MGIDFDIAGEIFTLPEEAVVLMAEDLRLIKTNDETGDEEATALADKLERNLVRAYDGPVRITQEDALTILQRKCLDALAVGPYGVPAQHASRDHTDDRRPSGGLTRRLRANPARRDTSVADSSKRKCPRFRS